MKKRANVGEFLLYWADYRLQCIRIQGFGTLFGEGLHWGSKSFWGRFFYKVSIFRVAFFLPP